MWFPKGHGEKKEGNGLVAVAIDKDKGSQHALRWAVDNLLTKGQTIVLIHVLQRASASYTPNNAFGCNIGSEEMSPHKEQLKKQTESLFITFHCFCTRKDIQCLDIVLEDTDVAKAITEYVSYAAMQNLVLGAASRHGFIRFKSSSVPSNVSKGAPDFCTVYVISKGKISTMRNASRPAPFNSPLLLQIQKKNNEKVKPPETPSKLLSLKDNRASFKPHTLRDDSVKSPFIRAGKGLHFKLPDPSESDTDISFVSSGRPSTDQLSSLLHEYVDSGPRLSSGSEQSHGSGYSGSKLPDLSSLHEFSSFSQSSGRSSSYSNSSQITEDVEAEMKRLQLELKQTMVMYSAACKDALVSKQKAVDLHRWRVEEEQKLEEAKQAQEAALSVAEKEKAKCRTAMEEAEAAKRIAEMEAQKRETENTGETENTSKIHSVPARYRTYTIDEIEQATEYFADSRKVGEGGYGPVFKCYLDHTPVAVKVLRPDANQGRLQFNQEIEILSCIRHPNIVLLLGACPEYGCLVYEYMGRGSLEDRLIKRAGSPVLPWQFRFRIAAEIAMGLLFLHQTKPEPIVHRDLKPGNVLLDNNYVAKVSDVGLARLVPAVADNVTQYHMTSTAGTFCYIDPEYQQTGMLGVKSDVYAFGIMLLQLLTAKPPMGLTHYVEQAIENDTFSDMLDPEVPEWPVAEALCLAKMGLQCAELRRKDRPDLGKVIMPELNKLRELAEDRMDLTMIYRSAGPSPNPSQTSVTQEVMGDTVISNPGSSKSESIPADPAEEQSDPSAES